MGPENRSENGPWRPPWRGGSADPVFGPPRGVEKRLFWDVKITRGDVKSPRPNGRFGPFFRPKTPFWLQKRPPGGSRTPPLGPRSGPDHPEWGVRKNGGVGTENGANSGF